MTEWPPKLTLETEPVLKLFTGENFYSSADAALREAVLNSIDAIGRRKEVNPALESEIDVVFDREKQLIQISDNGIGMNQEDLANLYTKIGASAAQLSNGTDYKAVGEFGIGALSYFLICNHYELQTFREGHEPVGLAFSKGMLDGKTQATEVQASQENVGTTLYLHLDDPKLLEICTQKFPHWLRSVEGLTGQILPEGKTLEQGGLTRSVKRIETADDPEWLEATEIGPPEDLSVWDSYDGKGQVDVLYRGVFVERLVVDQLWGLEGAIHVDPKHFRPMLNREGFVGENLKSELTPFLQKMHPAILERAIECIHDLLDSSDAWNNRRAITLWLAVPRRQEYSVAMEKWDDEFKNRKAFTLLGKTGDSEVSIADIISKNADKIFLAPDQDNNDPLQRQAVRVLRGKGSIVVRGMQRDKGYLQSAPVQAHFSSWLLLNTFREELPPVEHVQNVAQSLLSQDSVALIYKDVPLVKIVELGTDSVPFIAVGNEIWVNIEVDAGKEIVGEICLRNEGHIGLWIACMMHAPGDQHLNQIGNLLRKHKPDIERLGLVRRQYLRSLLQ